eukprot:TCALIF_05845-PA protein Name:"Protein of unknown function" AED:0.15 eAED:0.15 QI:133/1/1/1/0.33/0.25/4/202/343
MSLSVDVDETDETQVITIGSTIIFSHDSDSKPEAVAMYSRKLFHCLKCQKVLTSRRGRIHHETRSQCHLTPCSEKHEHEPVHETFPSLDAAKAWIVEMEWDQSFSITQTKSEYVRYRCRHRPRYQDQQDSHIPKKRLTGKVSSYDCQAKLAIVSVMVCKCVRADLQSNVCQSQGQMFQLRGCLTHSHPPDFQAQRISRLTRDSLITLLKAGLSKRDILKQYCNVGHSDDNPCKIVTMQDLRNIEKFCKKSQPNNHVEIEPVTLGPAVTDIPEETSFQPIQLDQNQLLADLSHNLDQVSEEDRQTFLKKLVQFNLEVKTKAKAVPTILQKSVLKNPNPPKHQAH